MSAKFQICSFYWSGPCISKASFLVVKIDSTFLGWGILFVKLTGFIHIDVGKQPQCDA